MPAKTTKTPKTRTSKASKTTRATKTPKRPVRSRSKKAASRATTKSSLLNKSNILIAFALLVVIGIVSVLATALAASSPSFNFGHKTYSLSSVQSKGYAKTNIAAIADAASTSTYAGQSCRDAWNSQSKVKTSFTYFCWRGSDRSGGWVPQGVTGSASAQTTAADGRKDILVVSWYSTGKPSLVAATQTSNSADSASRISVVNMSTKKYSHVELAKPCSQSDKKICKLNSHSGGIAWAGQYLYLASTTGLYVFNLNDMFVVNGKPVLVASEWYGLKAKDGEDKPRISTVSFDSSANQLVTAEYHRADTKQPSWVVRWDLDANHHLATSSTVSAASKFNIKAYSIQGVASYQGKYLAHSSSEKAPGRNGVGGTLITWQKPSSLTRARMPYHLESAYYDTDSNRIWGVTENGSHSSTTFVLSYPSSLAF